MARARRAHKLLGWQKKQTLPGTGVVGIDRIKVLKCQIIKKEIIKGRDGDVITNNLGPVLFKRRAKVEEQRSENKSLDRAVSSENESSASF